MEIPESSKIPAEIEISMNLNTLLQVYDMPESMAADILLTDEITVQKSRTQKNDQISNDMLFRLWRFAVKILKKNENKSKEDSLVRCALRLEKATDKEIGRRMML
jgi:hypothetical protein